MQREAEDLRSHSDVETKAKLNHERLVKQLEQQIQEMQTKYDQQAFQLQDIQGAKLRSDSETSAIVNDLEAAKYKITELNRGKTQFQGQIEEIKRLLADETRVRNHFVFRNITIINKKGAQMLLILHTAPPKFHLSPH